VNAATAVQRLLALGRAAILTARVGRVAPDH
jgi:hypothetical protein